MAGVFLALITLQKKGVPKPPLRLPPWVYRWVLAPGLVVLIAILPEPMGRGAHRWGFVVLWFLSALLVYWSARDENLVLGFPIIGRALEWVGARSYAMYLLHWSLFAALLEIAERTGWRPDTAPRAVGVFAICVAVTCVGSDIAHRWVERPFIAAGRAHVESWKKDGPRARVIGWRTLAAVVIVLVPAASVWSLLDHHFGAPVWRAEYFAGQRMEGAPTKRDESEIVFFWGEEGPMPSVPPVFSARYKTCLRLDHDTDVRFDLGSDDGSRLLVDDKIVIDQWVDQWFALLSRTIRLAPGIHTIEMDYYNRGGLATATYRMGFDGAHPSAANSALFLPSDGSGCTDTVR